jgi:anaerobic ribonucleoside-triphosphate reductase activating protein
VDDAIWAAFDYVKVGPYVEELGPLNKPTTNQRLYRALKPGGTPVPGAAAVEKAGRRFQDITARFWHRGLEAGEI